MIREITTTVVVVIVALATSFIVHSSAAANVYSDSVPCVIVTTDELRPVFDDYAAFKTRHGLNTEVITLTEIDTMYAGDTVVTKIREYLRNRYTNNYTEFAILGGDVDVVPGTHVDWYGGIKVFTDMCYSCLNGEWDTDNDDVIAEPPAYGDTVDFSRQLAVGRFPCRDTGQARILVNKVLSYMTYDGGAGTKTSALLMSTWLTRDNDGAEINAALAAILPAEFDTVTFYQEFDPENVFAAMNAGPAITINNSHAQWEQSFLTYFIDGPPNGSTRRYLTREDIDTLSNTNSYGVFFNYACYNGMLDSAYALARHYMLCPSGGGAGYVGSTNMEWSVDRLGFHEEILNQVFDSGAVQIGKALSNARELIVPSHELSWGSKWCLFFSTIYLGDPSMEIWTTDPGHLVIANCADTLEPGQQALSVLVSCDSQPVQGVTVCVWKQGDAYATAVTDSLGVANLTEVDFQTEGEAYVSAVKHDFFPAERTIALVKCCSGRVGDANCSGGDEPTVLDINAIQDFLYGSGDPLCCLTEADVNQSGGGNPTGDDITITDINILVDYLYISGPYDPVYNPEGVVLPDCL